MQLDAEDWRLVRALQADARRSFRDLASLTGLSTPTVSARVKRLEEMGLVQGYTVRLDERLLGRRGLVLVGRARPADAAALARALAEVPGVEETLALAGGLVHARAHVASVEDEAALHGALAALPMLVSYEAHAVLDARRAPPPPPSDATEVQLACHECEGPIHGGGVRKRLADAREHWFCCRSCLSRFEERLAKLRP